MFAGYDPFAAIGAARLVHKFIPPPLIAVMRRAARLLPGSGRNMSLDFRVTCALEGVAHPPSLWTPIWMAPLFPDDINSFFGTSLSAEEIYSEAFEAWNGSTVETIGDRMMEYFIRFYLPNDILTKSDRASMQNSLELRSPFLDNDLADFSARLPYRFKHRGLVRKFILKRAAGKLLPDEIVNRPKKGFGIPLRDWMCDRSLQAPSEILAAVNPGLVQRYGQQHSDGEIDRRFFLWTNMVLAHSQAASL